MTIVAEEIPVVFECEGAKLLGMIHLPLEPMAYGVLTLVAGGPQYRAGCGRQLVSMSRELAGNGVPVMRFDHRGLGDSSGEFLGFEHVLDDLRAAIDCFLVHAPSLRGIILWGGCDAASAILIHTWQLPEVVSVVLGNPFVSSETTQAAVMRQHYLKRLGQWSFWRKLFTGQYKLLDYTRSTFGKLAKKGSKERGNTEVEEVRQATSNDSYIDRMLRGFERFEGSALFLMSGQSLISKEFDALVARSQEWSELCSRSSNRRIDLPEADQTFSSLDARKIVNDSVCQWVKELEN